MNKFNLNYFKAAKNSVFKGVSKRLEYSEVTTNNKKSSWNELTKTAFNEAKGIFLNKKFLFYKGWPPL